MKSANISQLALGLCASISLPISSAVHATVSMEEIVVTAQKRPENLQDVPLAVTVFDNTLLTQTGITTIQSLAQFTPGFTLTAYNKTTPQPYIRGIGSNTSGAGDDASVGIFVDEVFISRAGAFDTHLFDIERIEVLRGPQGTLYGKNVAGGALNITTQRPDLENVQANLRLEAGTFEQKNVQLYANGPLARNVAGKISLALDRRDGLLENTVTGTDLRDENTQAARVALLWQASEDLTAELNLDHASVQETGVGRVLQGAPAFGFAPSSPSINNPGYTDSSIDGYTTREISGTSINLTWQQPYGNWTSITAYRQTDFQFSDELVPALGAPHFIKNDTDEKQHQFSQEVRLSNPDAAALEWTLGTYYFEESIARVESFNTTHLGGGLGTWDANNKTKSRAVFAQFGYQWSLWQFDLGGRFTEEEKDFDVNATGSEPLLFNFRAPYATNAEKTWRNFSGKASINYLGIDDTLIYLSLSEGFKSGAFNSLSASQSLAETPLKPELATQWELGMKSQWLNNRARLNLAIFDIQYDDLQIFETVGLDVFVGNAGQASIQGAEIEFNLLPLPQLELSGNYAYLDARYDEYLLGGVDHAGNQLSRSPKNTVTFSALYEFSPIEAGVFEIRCDYLHQGMIFRTADNSDGNKIAGYSLINTRLSFKATDDRWKMSLWGKNLGNSQYEVFRNDLSYLGAATTSDIMGDPRTLGISIAIQYE